MHALHAIHFLLKICIFKLVYHFKFKTMMKKTIFTSVAALLCLSLNAQLFQINPYAGWSTASALQMYLGKARTTADLNYGVNLSFGQGASAGGFTRNAFVELQYNLLQTDLEYRDYTTDQDYALSDIAMHNIMLGGTKESGNGKVMGYGAYYLGITIFDVSNFKQNVVTPEDHTRFTMALGAGLKYAASDRVGIRLHAQMYMPFWGSDFYAGWSLGGGPSAGVVATAVNVYANFNGGIYFNLGE